jgi:hypothetical protein
MASSSAVLPLEYPDLACVMADHERGDHGGDDECGPGRCSLSVVASPDGPRIALRMTAACSASGIPASQMCVPPVMTVWGAAWTGGGAGWGKFCSGEVEAAPFGEADLTAVSPAGQRDDPGHRDEHGGPADHPPDAGEKPFQGADHHHGHSNDGRQRARTGTARRRVLLFHLLEIRVQAIQL